MKNELVMEVEVTKVDARTFDSGSNKTTVNGVNKSVFKKSDGSEGEAKLYMNFFEWGELGEQLAELKVGDLVSFTGSLTTESWDDKNNPGQKVYRTVTRVKGFQKLKKVNQSSTKKPTGKRGQSVQSDLDSEDTPPF